MVHARPSMVSRYGMKLAVLLLLLSLVLATAGRALAAAPASDPHTMVSRSGRVAGKAPAAGGEIRAGNPGTDRAEVEGVEGKGDYNATVVVGADNRIRVTNTTAYPWRTMVHLVTNFGTCSGFLIDDDTVATAGHCIYRHAAGGWATSVTAIVGRNGAAYPYAPCHDLEVYSTAGWLDNALPTYDYGAVKLDCQIGDQVGWLGFRVAPNSTGVAVVVSGYPNNRGGQLWKAPGTITATQTAMFKYNNDTTGGMNGAPVWNNITNCSPCAIAINTRNNVSTSYNMGIRITQSVYNNLVAWSNATPTQ